MDKYIKITIVFFTLITVSFAQDRAIDDFLVDETVIIKTRDGTPISAIVALDGNAEGRQPAALMYSIYTSERDAEIAKYAVRKGYASVIAYVRGVRTGAVDIEPYEHDAEDVYDVIEWISEQSWSNGKVGMYGGSYAGFTQWAVARLNPPALKTIVPQVAAAPGIGEPYENNVFMNQLAYVWPLNNDDYKQVPGDFNSKWYQSGSSYRALDTYSGHHNRTFQRWLEHPDFDGFWRAVTTDGDEFKKINIPVLTTTGYYDPAQLSAMYYFREHYKHNKNAEHYLVIGPYDHFGGQIRPQRELGGYAIDPEAYHLMGDLVFEWFDYVLKGRERPALVKDRVNFQVMGANKWRHVPSVRGMSNKSLKLYLSMEKSGQYFMLTGIQPEKNAFHHQTVDFTDRSTQNNTYTPLVINDELTTGNGITFISDAMEQEVELNGPITGELNVTINNRDVDVSMAFYELMPDGRYFHLNRYIGRASYARDNSRRQLLTPGEKNTIPFNETRLTGRKLAGGSRLVLVLNVNKNPFEQINYGTGNDVSDESIEDVEVPLEIKWHTDSYIQFPLWLGE